MAAPALITTTQYTALTGKTIAQALLDAINYQIERVCDRPFDTADRVEWLNGTGTSSMFLNVWPVNTIHTCLTGSSKVTDISHTGTAKLIAIEVNATHVNLRAFKAGSWQTDQVAFSSNASVSDVRAAIDALADWSASVSNSDLDDFPSTYLQPRIDTENDGSIDTGLYIPDIPVIVTLDPETSRMVVSSSDTITGEFRNQAFENQLTRAGWMGGTHTVYQGQYLYGFPHGVRNVLFNYNAGYTLGDGGNVPEDLQIAAAKMAGELEQQINSAGVESKKLGDYSYKMASGLTGTASNVVNNNLDLLTFWRRLEF